ncbi:GntR family transcriptional regulator [Streptomyces sp. Lzd4kr]|nr:GntR family transcriptional regulator [Streptomyces sp. Lzd4kr]
MSIQAEPSGIKLTRVSTVDALVAALRESILSGSQAAGTALREADLARSFGVSRHSLRTALQELIHDGLVVHEVNRGVFVKSVTRASVRDIYQLRELLEVEAASELSRRPDRLAVVRATLDALEALPSTAPWGEARDADLAFHRALVDALGRPRTSQTFASLAGELRLAFLQIKTELEDRADVARQHREIFDAIAAGKRGEAMRLVRAHLRAAQIDICTALEAGGAD